MFCDVWSITGVNPRAALHSPASEVITGPSGVGKSTLIKKLMAEFPDHFGFSVSHTTREPRPGEQAGIDYHFVSREQMQQDIEAGLFVEHAEVHGNLYGTSMAAVQAVTRQGKVCLLDIDVQGAESVRRSALASTCSFVFFAPPTAAVLEQRLRGRGTETEEKIQKRLGNSLKELAIYEAKPDAWDLTLQWYNEQVEDTLSGFALLSLMSPVLACRVPLPGRIRRTSSLQYPSVTRSRLKSHPDQIVNEIFLRSVNAFRSKRPFAWNAEGIE